MKKFKDIFIKSSSKMALCLMTCMSVSMLAAPVTPVLAESTSKSVSVISNGEMGAVDISLIKNAEPISGAVLPGQVIGLDCDVQNNAEPAWIRVKTEYDTDYDGDTYVLNDECLTLANEEWVKIGDYYYYTKAVENNDKVDFVDSLKIPNEWDSSTSNHNYDVMFTAEAVQEKFFTPDFTSTDPWHGTVIQAFETENYQLKSKGNAQFQIVCQDGSEQLISVGDDFFSNWEKMMPGDTLKGNLVISNKMKVPVKMFFKTETTSEYDELLKQMTIKIMNGNTVIYDGPMSTDVNPEVLLQEYASNSNSTLSYEIKIPAELDNEYALKKLKSVWTFRVEIPGQEITIKPPKTGDETKTSVYILLGVASLTVIVVLIAKKRKENR